MKSAKILLVIAIFFLSSTVAISQTVLEKEVADTYLKSLHYLGFDPFYENRDDDHNLKGKVNDFLYGTITEKKELLKTYITNTLLPKKRAKRDKIQARLTAQENSIAALEAYIK